MDRVAFIINPFSAKKNYLPFLNTLSQKITSPKVYISDSIEGTQQFIRDNFYFTDIFVAVGGDGTISTIAAMLINTEKILAIFPAGSGNGFSRETNFNKDLEALLAKIRHKNTQKVDTFTVNGQLSINVSGVGFDGSVAREFEKTSRGFGNYIKVCLRTFFKHKPLTVSFLDEKLKVYDGKYLMLNIANTRQFGNNAYIAPNASITDGLLDLVLVKKFPLHYAPKFAYRMFVKKLKEDAYLTYITTPKIRFSVDTETWHLDGEYRKIPSPIEVKVLPLSLRLLV